MAGRQITDSIILIQGSIHSSFSKRGEKAWLLSLIYLIHFDKVSHSFLFFVLDKFGFSVPFIKWIKAYITKPWIAPLFNCRLAAFFQASRGLRQGFPLSPLLFILVIEGLSLLIKDAQNNGKIRGIKISPQLSLTHLLFVDDLIMFGTGTFEEWVAFKVILDTFYAASGMCINMDKPCFLFNNIEEGLLNMISGSLSFKYEPITKGFNYLGYYPKPLGYLVKD